MRLSAKRCPWGIALARFVPLFEGSHRSVAFRRLGVNQLSDERSTNEVDKRIGARVRARRLDIGMSQETLADILGVTFQQVQKYEKGVNRIAASRLYDISAALKVSVASFFENLSVGHRGQNAGPRTEELLATPGALELVRLFVSIENARLRRRVLELVRAMVNEKV